MIPIGIGKYLQRGHDECVEDPPSFRCRDKLGARVDRPSWNRKLGEAFNRFRNAAVESTVVLRVAISLWNSFENLQGCTMSRQGIPEIDKPHLAFARARVLLQSTTKTPGPEQATSNTLCTYPLSSQLWKPESAPAEQVV